MNDPRKHEQASAIIAECMRRKDAGETINPEQLLAEHPESADELREYFDAERRLGIALGAPDSGNEPMAKRATVGPGAGDSVPAGGVSFEQLPFEFGRYRVQKVLGQGAMGAVYLAHDTKLARDVALKTPKLDALADGELVERFEREARAAATLHHRNICPVFDVGEIGGVRFLTMAYIEGKPLSAFVSEDKPMSRKQAATVVRKLALGLQEAHDHGVVHRDLKPANVMVDKSREPVVMDFGLAHQTENAEKSRLTGVGVLMGSPAYMSPEQVSGEPDAVGPATDIYSLGVILFELLTGRLPFEGNVVAIIGQIVSSAPPTVSDFRSSVDGKLTAICSKMMTKSTADRYASMKEVADALTAYLRDYRKSNAGQSGAQSIVASDLAFDESAVGDQPLPAIKPKTKAKRRKTSRSTKYQAKWFAGGLLGLLLLAVIIIKFPGGTTVEISGDADAKIATHPDGSLKSVEITPKATEAASDRSVADVPASSEGDEDGFVDLFNGNDLTGWTIHGGQAWSVANSEIVCAGNASKLVHNSGPFTDFELQLECWLEPGANSGLFLRTEQNRDHLAGYEIQLANSFQEFGTGSIWDRAAFDDSVAEDLTWFPVAVRVQGKRITVEVNGRETVDYTDSGGAFPVGHIGLQGHIGTGVRFRNIRIKKLSPRLNQQPVPPATASDADPVGSVVVTHRSVEELNQQKSANAYAWVSPDALTIYWMRENDVPDPYPEILQASRPTVDAKWQDIRTVANGRMCAIAEDGRFIAFFPGNYQSAVGMFGARRTSMSEPFGTPELFDSLKDSLAPKSRWLSADGRELVFQRKTSQHSRKTEFVVCTRKSGTDEWSEPQELPTPTDPRFTEPLTWPHLSADGLEIWFCHGGNRESEIVHGSRPSKDKPFGGFEFIELDGKRLIGRAPRFVPATGELYYSHPVGDRGWQVWVTREAELSPLPEQLSELATGTWVPILTSAEGVLNDELITWKDGTVELEKEASTKASPNIKAANAPTGRNIILRADINHIDGHSTALRLDGPGDREWVQIAKTKADFVLTRRDDSIGLNEHNPSLKPPADISGFHDVAVAIIDGDVGVYLDGDLLMTKPAFCRVDERTPSINGFNWGTDAARAQLRNVRVMVLDSLPAAPETVPAIKPAMPLIKLTGKMPPHAAAPFNSRLAENHQQAWAKYLGVDPTVELKLGGDQSISFVLIPPGRFRMGSTKENIDNVERAFQGISGTGRVIKEAPQHQVSLTQPFFLGQHEVTRGQFRRFIEATGHKTVPTKQNDGTPTWDIAPNGEDDMHPMAQISHGDSVAFCAWLSKEFGHTFQLPTEAQWEYACRAGSSGNWCCGDNVRALQQYCRCGADGTLPVGSLHPNAFGLHDMHGNVAERCIDWYDSKYASSKAVTDPTGPPNPALGSWQVFRGGNWTSSVVESRSGHRERGAHNLRNDRTGFRAVMVVPLPKTPAAVKGDEK